MTQRQTGGIVVSEDQSSLLIAETARYRVWKV